MRRFHCFVGACLLGALIVPHAFGQPPHKPDGSAPVRIDAADRKEVVESLAKELEARYVFADKARAMATAIRGKLADKSYDAIANGQDLAKALTADLRAVTADRHLRVSCSTEATPKPDPKSEEPTPDEIRQFLESARRRNGGFVKLERLPGNVGYLDLRGFMPPEAAAEPLAAAMNFLANTDALILDLRKNGGGAPGGVRLVCSYLFPAEPSVHLNSLYFRPRDETREFWTLKDLPAKRFIDKDVYVLTSRFTFSGAEECAYNLQTRKRATIVGETTGGGAHPGGRVWLSDHFAAFIPSGRAINPVTKTNWEGTGVQPDVAVDADAAFETAHGLAIKKIRETCKDSERLKQLDEDLESEKAAKKRYDERNR